MGENIGDLSGVAISLQAYHVSLGGKPAPVLDGFTGDQRFFLAFAQVWRGKYRDAAMRQQVLTNPHSPAALARRRPDAQRRRLVRRVRREAGRQDVPGAGSARASVVTARRAIMRADAADRANMRRHGHENARRAGARDGSDAGRNRTHASATAGAV